MMGVTFDKEKLLIICMNINDYNNIKLLKLIQNIRIIKVRSIIKRAALTQMEARLR